MKGPPAIFQPVPTILLVDDEGAVRIALRTLFERAGFAVVEANSGLTALEAVTSDPDISAVVSALRGAGIHGLALYEALIAQAPRLRHQVVFLTSGPTRDPATRESLEQRGLPLVNKLDDPQIVVDAVRLALMKRRQA